MKLYFEKQQFIRTLISWANEYRTMFSDYNVYITNYDIDYENASKNSKSYVYYRPRFPSWGALDIIELSNQCELIASHLSDGEAFIEMELDEMIRLGAGNPGTLWRKFNN
jgi:hypothetical protein